MNSDLTLLKRFLVAAVLLIPVGGLVGCEDKETILDIETPDGGLEIERSESTGNIDVKVDNH